MNTNRIFYMLVALALAAVMFFTFHEAASTAAIAQADRSYDQVEQARTSGLNASLQADGSYSQLETIRLDRSAVVQDQSYSQVESLRIERGATIADRSYDAIENLRAARGTS